MNFLLKITLGVFFLGLPLVVGAQADPIQKRQAKVSIESKKPVANLKIENTALFKKLDRLEQQLKQLRGKIVMAAIDAGEKQLLLTDIDTQIIWLADQKKQVPSDKSSRKEKQMAHVRVEWGRQQVAVKRVLGLLQAAQIEQTIMKVEDFAARFHLKIRTLEAAGIETKSLVSALAPFQSQIVKAKEKQALGKQAFSKIRATSDDQGEGLYKSGQNTLKEAQKHLQKASQDLKKAIELFKKEVEISWESTSELGDV
jgi:hypothetical protein